jgi:cation diffusion facilitator family transporter
MHTLADLSSDLLVLYALKHSAKEADEEHPYGHARIETAVTLVLGVLLLLVGAGIAARAGMRLMDPEAFVTPAAITLWVSGFTILAKEGLYQYTMRAARRFDSDMLKASAWHHRSDAISSIIVFLGIAGTIAGMASRRLAPLPLRHESVPQFLQPSSLPRRPDVRHFSRWH